MTEIESKSASNLCADPAQVGSRHTFEWEFDFPVTTNPAYEAKRHLNPNPPMGGVKAGQIGMREPTREKAWAPLGPM